MKQKSRILNIILIVIIFLLLGWGADRILNPQFPSRIDGAGIPPEHRELVVPDFLRKGYSSGIIGEVARLNLFRKEREAYRPPRPKPKPRSQPKPPPPPKVTVAPPPPPPPKPVAPPPKLVLTGVMLMFDGQKLAFFEGTFSEVRAGRVVQDLKPRRRGYRIGESLGSYTLEAIDKNHAVLREVSGTVLILRISKTPADQQIQKAGSHLINRSKPVSVPQPSSFSRNNNRPPVTPRQAPSDPDSAPPPE